MAFIARKKKGWFGFILEYALLMCFPFICHAALMSSMYEEHKDEDGFLYIT